REVEKRAPGRVVTPLQNSRAPEERHAWPRRQAPKTRARPSSATPGRVVRLPKLARDRAAPRLGASSGSQNSRATEERHAWARRRGRGRGAPRLGASSRPPKTRARTSNTTPGRVVRLPKLARGRGAPQLGWGVTSARGGMGGPFEA